MSHQVLDRPLVADDLDKRRAAAEAAAKKFPPLLVEDRCDASVLKVVEGNKSKATCGAQAFVRVVLPSGFDLIFCGHCIAELTDGKIVSGAEQRVAIDRRAALKEQGAYFMSQYDTINKKPTDTTPQTANSF